MDARPGWLDHFPALAALDDPAWHEVLTASRTMTVPAGTTVFHEGAECTVYMLVLHGSVRVQKTAENGREITLYRVENGQSCVLTTSCLL
ncbi:MAG TPA: cyclic nucleotide-binding domain-containing protein, partial [Gammaproteobacteria bacterium]|nr:cyclic nucleotide-binding domain-containing protein [Gammaproteobacteria bacterium]